MIKQFLIMLMSSFLLLQPTGAWAMSAAIEQDVLEVIAQHPEAIINSLKAYNQKQRYRQIPRSKFGFLMEFVSS